MSEEFKFEDRYIVIKRSDVERFWRDDVRDQFMAALGRLNEHDVRIPQRQYLVIESDWPEFYPAFQMIEARVNGKPAELEVLRAQLANTEQSRRSFFDLSQDLEKRLAERDALLAKCKDWIEAARDGVLYPIASEFQGVVGHNAEGLGQQSVALLNSLSICEESRNIIELSDGPLIDEGTKAACSRCGDWGHIETEDSAHDCPECGPSLVERAVEAGVMNAPSKPKTCIECDQHYCHGVCVERGDQDYDRDKAAKGGEQ